MSEDFNVLYQAQSTAYAATSIAISSTVALLQALLTLKTINRAIALGLLDDMEIQARRAADNLPDMQQLLDARFAEARAIFQN